MTDCLPQHFSTSDTFDVTQRLLEFLPFFQGSELTLDQVELINTEVLDLISGLVISQGFGWNGQCLEQVTLQAHTQENFILTNNLNFGLGTQLLSFLNSSANSSNTGLINRPKIIQITNLNRFQSQFKGAAQFKQLVTCIYNRATSEITLLDIRSVAISQLAPIATSHQPEQEQIAKTPFPIKIRFVGPFSTNQRSVFEMAANRWGGVINDNLPPFKLNNEEISGLIITAVATQIDGPNKKLGQSAPLHLRPGSLLPATGVMEFDTADLEQIETSGNLVNVVMHEMGHVLGFGTLWKQMGLLKDAETNNPTFIGKNAMHAYAQLVGSNTPLPVPVENIGGVGTRNGHWRDSVFGNEVMTSFVGGGLNPLSWMTLASLQDIGYLVNFNGADPYVLPSNSQLTHMDIVAKQHNQRCSRCAHHLRNTESVVLSNNAIMSNH